MQDFPVDDFPTDDPFLPWIHDYFPVRDGKSIKFVAQNRRRCDTGEEREAVMSFWEPQISLFQPVPVVQEDDNTFYLTDSQESATHPETRFICRFHTTTESLTTLSEYPFNYEYVTWRKNKQRMFEVKGKDVAQFWLSTLLFSCPVPEPFQEYIREMGDSSSMTGNVPRVYLDLIPIRTPAREKFFLNEKHVGQKYFERTRIFNATLNFGRNHRLPDLNASGRWQNLPICPLAPLPATKTTIVSDLNDCIGERDFQRFASLHMNSGASLTDADLDLLLTRLEKTLNDQIKHLLRKVRMLPYMCKEETNEALAQICDTSEEVAATLETQFSLAGILKDEKLDAIENIRGEMEASCTKICNIHSKAAKALTTNQKFSRAEEKIDFLRKLQHSLTEFLTKPDLSEIQDLLKQTLEKLTTEYPGESKQDIESLYYRFVLIIIIIIIIIY